MRKTGFYCRILNTARKVCVICVKRRTAQRIATLSNLVRASRATAARNRALADDRVVVSQLFAAPDRARRPDPDRLVDDIEVTVRPARMVDEAHDVAVDVGVATPRAVHTK